MKRFELIGPSGVGKTTLYNKISSTGKNRRNYLTVKEAYKHVAINTNLRDKVLLLRLYQQLLKFELFKNKELGLARKALQIKQKKNNLVNRNDYKRFSTSFKILYNHQRNKNNPVEVSYNLFAFTSRIEDYLILESLLNGDHRILFDDGMIHMWGVPKNFTTDTITPEEIKKDELFNPAGVILCEHTPEAIYDQAMKRKAEGLNRFSMDHFTDAELKAHIKNDIENLKYKALFFMNLDVPVLALNMGEDDELIMQKINRFVAEI